MSRREYTPEDVETLRIVSGTMVEDILRGLSIHKEHDGTEFTDDLSMSVIATLICSLLNSKLQSKDVAEQYRTPELLKTRYDEFKASVQNAVSSAFEGAIAEYSGKQTEYYCMIKVMPKPINGLPC